MLEVAPICHFESNPAHVFKIQLTRPSKGGWLIPPVYLGQWSEPLLHLYDYFRFANCQE